MITETDLRKRHDIIEAFLNGEVIPLSEIEPKARGQLAMAKVTLGWAIGCPTCTAMFNMMVGQLDRIAASNGFVLEDVSN